jgi:hypothetical protein
MITEFDTYIVTLSDRSTVTVSAYDEDDAKYEAERMEEEDGTYPQRYAIRARKESTAR